MYELFFIIIIAGSVKFINRGISSKLDSHCTTMRFYHRKCESYQEQYPISNGAYKPTTVQYWPYNQKNTIF